MLSPDLRIASDTFQFTTPSSSIVYPEMRPLLLIGLIVLTSSAAYTKERRDRYRKYGPFGLKDKRGTDYVSGYQSPGGPPTGYFQPISGSITSHPSTRSIASYSQHQGLDQSSLSHGSPYSLMGSSGHGLGSIGMSIGGHSGQMYTFPASSLQLSSSKTPLSFGFHNGLSGYTGSAYMKPIYSSGLQSLSGYTSGGSHGSSMLPADASSYSHASYSLPAEFSSLQTLQSLQSHSSNPPESSHGISGGLVFRENPHGASLSYNTPSISHSNQESSPNYHIGLSSGSSDSSSYHLPISSNSYPVESSQSQSKHRPAPVSSAGSSYSAPSSSYSLPSTNYGIPSSYIQQHSITSANPTVHYSPPATFTSSHSTYNPSDSHDSSSNAHYPSQSPSYSLSEYSIHPQGLSSYGYTEQQASSSNIIPIHSRHHSAKSYDHADVPKYDTISYSSS